MANLLSLSQSISALGNKSAAMPSTGRLASGVQGNASVTPSLLNDETLDAVHIFSQLLNDSTELKSTETLKQKKPLTDEVDSSSVPAMDLTAAELVPLRGNKFPFEGQALPLSTTLVTEKLAERFYQISADQQKLADFSQGTAGLSRSLIDNSELALNNEALLNAKTDEISLLSLNLAESELTADTLLAQSREIFSSFSGQFSREPNANASHIGTSGVDQAMAGAINSDDIKQGRTKGVDSLNSTDGLSTEQDSDTEFTKFEGIIPTQGSKLSDKVLQAMAGAINSDDIKQGRTKGVDSLNSTDGLSTEQDSDTEFTKFEGIIPTQGSKLSDKVLQAMTGAINSDDIKQGPTKGVDFLNIRDGLSTDQDSDSEFTKFEGTVSTQGSKLSEKALQVMPGNFLAPTAAEAGVPQNQAVSNVPALTNALSQWRVDQDNNTMVTTDPLERQGFTKLSVPFNQSGWGENLGRQLSLLLAKNMDSAQIQLDPPELGPLVVKIQINQDQVSLQFTSGHAVVREALEQSSQRLQQMFNDEGLELMDVGVFDQKSGQDSEANESDEQGKSKSARADSSLNSAEESDGLLTHVRNIAVDNGNIDYFV
jgi:flagellar hook-length control protein FliK